MIMDISIFFGQLYGIFYIIFACLFIITRQLGRTIDMSNDRAFVIATGYTTFFLGLVTVILHNIWVTDWRVVITILGWSTLIKGIRKIGFPESISLQAQKFRKHQVYSTLFMFFLGVWLCWMGLSVT